MEKIAHDKKYDEKVEMITSLLDSMMEKGEIIDWDYETADDNDILFELKIKWRRRGCNFWLSSVSDEEDIIRILEV